MSTIVISKPSQIPSGYRFDGAYVAPSAEAAARELRQAFRAKHGRDWQGDVYVYEAKAVRRFRCAIVRGER